MSPEIVAVIVTAVLAFVAVFAVLILLSSHHKDSEGRSKDSEARRDHREAIQFQANVMRDIAIAVFRGHIALLQKDLVQQRRLMDEVQTMRMEPVPPRLQAVPPLRPATPGPMHRIPKPPPAASTSVWSDYR